MNDDQANLFKQRPEPPPPIEERQSLENVLCDGDTEVDWGERITYCLVGFIIGLYLLGWLFEYWHGVHFIEFGLCFVTAVIGGAYLGMTRQTVIKWVLVLTAVLTLGLLAF